MVTQYDYAHWIQMGDFSQPVIECLELALVASMTEVTRVNQNIGGRHVGRLNPFIMCVRDMQDTDKSFGATCYNLNLRVAIA